MATIKDLDYICQRALWSCTCEQHMVNGKLVYKRCIDCSHYTLCNMVLLSREMLELQMY